MNNERFVELIQGPLSHPSQPVMHMRLVGALRTLVEVAGKSGEKALEDFCAPLWRRDQGGTADG
jgi:hypothetical protein